MKKEIQDHYREEEIQKLKLHGEVENWKAEIAFMTKEISFFSSLLASLPEEKENNKKLLRELKATKQSNETYFSAILDFENKLEGINECDDLQCETFFLNSHEEFRDKIEKHVLQFRVLKGVIFSHLKKTTTVK